MGDSKLKRIVQLTGFSVSTGIGNMPYAFIKLNIDGNDHTATDYGVGPVDASPLTQFKKLRIKSRR